MRAASSFFNLTTFSRHFIRIIRNIFQVFSDTTLRQHGISSYGRKPVGATSRERVITPEIVVRRHWFKGERIVIKTLHYRPTLTQRSPRTLELQRLTLSSVPFSTSTSYPTASARTTKRLPRLAASARTAKRLPRLAAARQHRLDA
jgi:hypothetical protein